MKKVILTIAAVLTLMSCTTEDLINDNSIYAKVTSSSVWTYPTLPEQGVRFKYNDANDLMMSFVDKDTTSTLECYTFNNEYKGYYVSEDEFYVLWNGSELFFTMEGSLLEMKVQSARTYFETNSAPICN